MKLPVNGRWRVDQSTDKGVSILATKNIIFDQAGLATLAPRTINVFDTNSDGSFKVPLVAYSGTGAITKQLHSNNAPFSVVTDAPPYSITLDGLAGQPTGSLYSGGVQFNGTWVVSADTDVYAYTFGSPGTWAAKSLSLTTSIPHPLAVMKSNNTLLVGNGNAVKQYNTSYSATTNLALPSGTKVVSIAYNRSFAAVVCWNNDGEDSWLYIWDGATAGANYAYQIGARRGYFAVPYGSGFAILNGFGRVLEWNGDLQQLAAFPSAYGSAELETFSDTFDVSHSTSAVQDTGKILFNACTLTGSKNREQDKYNIYQPSGVWCYDPAVGLYHRGAPSGAKLLTKTVSTANVNTTTDVITVTATVPETGTPVIYTSLSTVIGGLAQNTTYYTIKLTSTTLQLATTRANALAGTYIDLTGTGYNSQYLLFTPESDFGQLAPDGFGAMLARTGPSYDNADAANFTIFSKYSYGFQNISQNSVSTQVDTYGFFMDRGENRGYIVTQKMFSPDITEIWQYLTVKARGLATENDKIVVKYRTSADNNMPIISRDQTYMATWVDSTSFTTTKDLTNVVAGYEIEFILGAASGYLAHIVSATNNAGTWTVVIDETVRNVAAGDTSNFVIDNWVKLPLPGDASSISSSSDPDGVDLPISAGGKWIQFKIELRGTPSVALEELELTNAPLQA